MPNATRLNVSHLRETPPRKAGVGESAAAASPVSMANATGAVEPSQSALSAPLHAEPTPQAEQAPGAVQVQAMVMQAVRAIIEKTEDVGSQFAEEARRIHYGEAEERGIRGQTSADELAALADEGIEVLALPLPRALTGPLQ